MRLIFALVLLIGLGIAGGAVYLAMERFNAYETALAKNQTAPVQKIEMTTVYVAAQSLDYGHILTKDDIKGVEWPVSVVPENTFTDEEDLLGTGEDRDVRTVIREMDPGEPIMVTKVTERGEDAGVSSRLEKGMSAFAIRVDVASGVSGFLRPGDRVDVYWTGRDRDQTVTKLLLEGLELVAIDQLSGGQRAAPTVARTVTVAADRLTIAKLVNAQASGSLLLSLRGIGDDETLDETVEVTGDDLLGREKVVQQEQRVCTIKTRKGAEVIEIPIPCNTN